MSNELQMFTASAETIGLPTRVMASARQRHFLIDATAGRDGLEPECPHAGEVFLASLAGCAAVILNSVARKREINPFKASIIAHGGRDPDEPAKFVSIEMEAEISGVDQKGAEELIGVFQAQCPIYAIAVAGSEVSIKVKAVS